MKIEEYYSEDPSGIRFSRQQASAFAKQVADDFNPLHDLDAKLFCVPGDLLFALVLSRYGINRHMRFAFSGMVGDGMALQFSAATERRLALVDAEGKAYLEVEHDGDNSQDPQLVQGITGRYVQFSGHTFPDILVPLMAEHGVMVNTARPLVIYQSMEIDLDHLEISPPELEYSGSRLEVSGKRGLVQLEFKLKSGAAVVGRGVKHMSLRGLRPFDQEMIDQLVDGYLQRKRDYTG